MLTLFTFDATSTSLVTAYIGEIMSDAGLLIALAIGIPLAFFVIRKVMNLMPRK